MAIVTAQQLQFYYDHYRDTEITFTKEMTRVLNIDPRRIYVKCNGNQWPCIINSTSFAACRIIVGVKGGAYAMLSQGDPGTVSIRFCFLDSNRQPVAFFVNGRVQEVKPYMDSDELSLITIEYSQRPPDDLIEKLGTLLDANANSIRKKDEQIILTPDAKRKLGLEKEESVVQVQGVPRHCILRSLSFSGMKVVMMGVQKFVLNQNAILQVRFQDPDETIQLSGTIVQADPVEGRKDIISASVQFDEKTISFQYKIRINNYLANAKKVPQDQQGEEAKKSEAEPPKAAAQEASLPDA